MPELRAAFKKINHTQPDVIRKILNYAEKGEAAKVQEWFTALKSSYHQDVLNAGLLEAAKSGDVSTIKWFLKQGADVNTQAQYFQSFTGENYLIGYSNSLKKTPLHYATTSGHEAAALLLLKHGAAIQTDARRHKPYETEHPNRASEAVKTGERLMTSLMTWMTVLTPRVHVKDNFADDVWRGYAALSHSVNTAIVHAEPLGISPDKQEALLKVKKKLSTLQTSFEKDQKSLTTDQRAELKEAFSNTLIKIRQSFYTFVLDHIKGLDWEMMPQLAKDQALREAASYNHKDIVTLLLEKEANPNAKDANGNTALHSTQNSDILKTFLDKGADVNAQDNIGRTIAHRLACRADANVFLTVMSYNPNLHLVTNRGRTVLHVAAANGRGDLCGLLVKKGVDINAEDHNKQTALHAAAAQKHSTVVTALINKGADVTAKDNKGDTPLHLALQSVDMVNTISKTEAVIERLLSASGIDINAQNNNGDTALHFAARLGSPELLGMLIKAGANKNIQNTEGKTPLEVTQSFAAKETLKDRSSMKAEEIAVS